MKAEAIERHLRRVLGEPYGGPSISYTNSEFVIYSWGDAPVRFQIHARGKTLSTTVRNYIDSYSQMRRKT